MKFSRISQEELQEIEGNVNLAEPSPYNPVMNERKISIEMEKKRILKQFLLNVTLIFSVELLENRQVEALLLYHFQVISQQHRCSKLLYFSLVNPLARHSCIPSQSLLFSNKHLTLGEGLERDHTHFFVLFSFFQTAI